MSAQTKHPDEEFAEAIVEALFESDGERRIVVPHPDGGYQFIKESEYERRKH